MTDRVAMNALDRALDDHDHLLLVYQPIHDARSGVIYGAEALLRQRRQNGEIRDATMIAEAAESSAGPELFMLDSLIVTKAYANSPSVDGFVSMRPAVVSSTFPLRSWRSMFPRESVATCTSS